jgi:hypothetical protein
VIHPPVLDLPEKGHPMRTTRGIATLTIAGLALAGLAACSGDDSDAETTTSAAATTEAPEPTDDVTEDATEDASDDASEDANDDASDDESDSADSGSSAGSGDSPEWAASSDAPGEQIATIEGESFTVDVYQVGTGAASKTGNFVNPDDNQPIIAEGDEIVYVNYVFTNTGSEDIPLSYTTVDVSARYADWPYMQGMDSVTDSAQYEEMGVVSSPVAPGSGDAPFLWAPGQVFSYGENFKYQAGSPITFEATLVPADESGDLVHDDRQEASVDATIS